MRYEGKAPNITKRDNQRAKKICRAVQGEAQKRRASSLQFTAFSNDSIRTLDEKTPHEQQNTNKSKQRITQQKPHMKTFLSETHESLCRSLARGSDSVVVSVG